MVKKTSSSDSKNGLAISVGVLLVLFFGAGFLFLLTFNIINAQEVAIVIHLGEVDRVWGPGPHWNMPFIESVVRYDVKTQKYEVEASAASKDLQDTKTKVALNYRIDDKRVKEIYSTLGENYLDNFVSPAIQETIKATTAEFNAGELITERTLVKKKIEELLSKRLDPRGIYVEGVSITNFEFSPEYHKAIEEKQVAQQLALKAENDLKRVEIETQQKVVQAEGDAKAIALIQQQLDRSPSYTQYLAVKQWNGILPMITGSGAVPFINIPGIKDSQATMGNS